MTEEQMRNIVHEAMEILNPRNRSRYPHLTDIWEYLIPASRVLSLPNCPEDLMYLVILNPDCDRRIPGKPLRASVLNNRTCPDGVRIADALTFPRAEKYLP